MPCPVCVQGVDPVQPTQRAWALSAAFSRERIVHLTYWVCTWVSSAGEDHGAEVGNTASSSRTWQSKGNPKALLMESGGFQIM